MRPKEVDGPQSIAARRFTASAYNRDPNFQSTQACTPVELFRVTFKPGAVGSLVARIGKTLIPDTAARCADIRDVIGVQEDRIGLRGNSQAHEFTRVARELTDFRTADVIEIAGVVRVANDPVSDFVKLSWDVAEVGQESLPLRWDSTQALRRIGVAKSENQHGVSFGSASGRDAGSSCCLHSDWLQEVKVGCWPLCSGLLRRKAEMLPKCTSEGFMRTVPGIKRNGKDVRRTVKQSLGGFAQTASPYIEREATTGGGAECAGEVIT